MKPSIDVTDRARLPNSTPPGGDVHDTHLITLLYIEWGVAGGDKHHLLADHILDMPSPV